ncbi:hypothetical protein MMC25_000617 [Agyrium rufum]|nr:hypothetical protein [Agyrium rufum]
MLTRKYALNLSDQVGTLLVYITVTLGVVKGHYGRHSWDTSVLQSTRPWFAVPVDILNWLATLVLPFAKITFLIFYIQIFRPFKWLRILCYGGIIFTSGAFFALLVAQLAFTTPHPHETWLELDTDPRYMIPLYHLSIPITTISLCVDVYIFVLPMLGVAKLKLSPRRRVGVVLVFLTGFTACIASFLTLIYKIVLNNNIGDNLWWSIPVNITILVELCVGVTVSSMPSIAGLVKHKFPNFSIIDYASSLLEILRTSNRPTRSKDGVSPGNSSAPRSREHLYRKFDVNEASEMSIGLRDIDLSELPNAKTHVRSTSGVDGTEEGGNHIQHEWQSTDYMV